MEKSKNWLSEEEKAILRQHFEEKRKGLLNQLAEVEAKIELYGGTSLKSRVQAKLPLPVGFPKGVKSVPDRIIHVIKDLGRMSTINQITDHYASLDPSIAMNGKIIRGKYSHIYSALLGKVKNGSVFRVQEKDGAFKYGLSDWQEADGSAKIEYR